MMPSTGEYRKAIDTVIRKLLVEQWGATYASEFCDGLLLRLITPVGKVKIHIWDKQVNIDIGNTNAYTNDISSDPLATIGERLNAGLVCHSDTSEEGTGS